MSTQENGEVGALSVLFPEQEVDIGGGKKVIMRPLTLDKLPLVMDSFQKVMFMVSDSKDKGETSAQTIMSGMAMLKEAIILIKMCISVPWEEVPATAAPILLKVFIEQNLNQEVVGNWIALAGGLTSRLPELAGGLPIPGQG